MRESVCILLFSCLAMSAPGVLVDDFDSYDLGPVDEVTTTWFANTVDNDAIIEIDPADPTNKVMSLSQSPSEQSAAYCVLSGDAIIAEGQTKTLFMRFRTNGSTDNSFGLTDLDAPPTGGTDWGSFRPQWRWTGGNLDARDGGGYKTLMPVVADTWYNLWVVIDNGADTIKLYVNTESEDATENDLLVSGTQSVFGFRSATTEALDRLYWKAQNNNASLKVFVDDINISPGQDLSFPFGLKPYSPSVEQTPDVANNDIDVVLKWKAGKDPGEFYALNPDIVDQYVFMSRGSEADPNLYYIGATGVDPGLSNPDSQYGPVNLNPGTTYKWAIVEAIDGYAHNGVDQPALTVNVSRLDAVEPNNIIGSIWSFSTILLVPSFTEQPVNQFVFAGETAVFSAILRDETDASYRWYKGTTALSDVSGKISGALTATLTILDAQDTDEDTYFCRAVNPSGTTDSSAVILQVKRLRSWYPLETDTADVVSGFDMTLMQEGTAGLPTLSAGSVDPSVGSASLLFDNGDHAADPNGQYAQIPAGAADYYDISITCWVYWEGGANWQRIFDFGNDTSHYMFLTPSNGSQCRFVLNNGGGEQIVSTSPLPTGQWVHVAATLGGNTGRLHINGEIKAVNTNVTINPIDIGPALNYIGKSQFTADAEFGGRIDDLRIYNYQLDPETIAEEYYNATGINPCIDASFVGYQYNLDNTGTSYCRVDLADFAVFVSSWMNQGLYQP